MAFSLEMSALDIRFSSLETSSQKSSRLRAERVQAKTRSWQIKENHIFFKSGKSYSSTKFSGNTVMDGYESSAQAINLER